MRSPVKYGSVKEEVGKLRRGRVLSYVGSVVGRRFPRIRRP
jgi:hypothetical protein